MQFFRDDESVEELVAGFHGYMLYIMGGASYICRKSRV